MNCIDTGGCLVASALQHSASAPTQNSERADKFSLLMADGGSAEHEYVASNTTKNPLQGTVGELLKSVQGFEPTGIRGLPALDSGPAAADAEHGMRQFSEQVLKIQADLLKSHLMMEMINSAKQGVSTLLQQQG